MSKDSEVNCLSESLQELLCIFQRESKFSGVKFQDFVILVILMLELRHTIANSEGFTDIASTDEHIPFAASTVLTLWNKLNCFSFLSFFFVEVCHCVLVLIRNELRRFDVQFCKNLVFCNFCNLTSFYFFIHYLTHCRLLGFLGLLFLLQLSLLLLHLSLNVLLLEFATNRLFVQEYSKVPSWFS